MDCLTHEIHKIKCPTNKKISQYTYSQFNILFCPTSLVKSRVAVTLMQPRVAGGGVVVGVVAVAGARGQSRVVVALVLSERAVVGDRLGTSHQRRVEVALRVTLLLVLIVQNFELPQCLSHLPTYGGQYCTSNICYLLHVL